MQQAKTTGDLKTFGQLQNAIAKWSEANFGDNSTNPPQNCILGINEELSELIEEYERNTENGIFSSEKIFDAIADTAIYLLDYCARRNFILQNHYFVVPEKHMNFWNIQGFEDILKPIVYHKGQMSRACLKQVQGIRKNENHRDNEINNAAQLYAWLEIMCEYFGRELIDVVNHTWNEIVSKRNWKENKNSGI